MGHPSTPPVVRAYADGDIPAMVAIYNQNCLADGMLSTISAESMAHQHAHTPDIERNTACALVDGTMVAYGRVNQRDELDGTRVYFHFIRAMPDFNLRQIVEPLLEWQYARLRELHAASAPAQGAAWLQTVAVAGSAAPYTPLLEELEYAPARYSYDMIRDLAQPIQALPLPERLELRPVTGADAPQIWAANCEAFRDHWGMTEETEQEYQSWLTGAEFQPELWQIAWDGPEIAGMVLNYVDPGFNREFSRQRGYTEGISVRRPWRRQGLAAALLARSLAMFQAMGMTEAALGVDAQNPTGALGVYQRAGFIVESETITYRRPFNLA